MTAEEHYLVGRIQDALAADPQINKQDVAVCVADSCVTLSGQTSTDERKQLIGELVSRLAPELDVRNELVVIEIAAPSEPEVIRP